MQTSTEKSKEARTIAMIVAHKAYRNAQFGESRERASPRGEICLVITSKLLREMEFGEKPRKVEEETTNSLRRDSFSWTLVREHQMHQIREELGLGFNPSLSEF